LSDKKINVLIVDDEEALLDSLRRRLGVRNFNVIAVNRGEKALEAARHNAVDVAVVDIKMPGIKGQEVMLALKKEYPWMEIIILTGHGSFDPEGEGIADKIHCCLGKPCDLATLQEALIDAYKKTVMNRKKIGPQEMNAMLSTADKKSPDDLLQHLKRIDGTH
jgi:DNA-binding NtrC family response regulator